MSPAEPDRERVEDLLERADEAYESGDLRATARFADEALAEAEKLRPSDPEEAEELRLEALLFLAEAYGEMGDFEKARESWRRVREIDPDLPEANAGEARLAFAAWEFEEAERLARQVPEDAPPEVRADALSLLVWLLEFRGEAREAERLRRVAAGLDPDRAPPPPVFSRDEVLSMLDDIVHSMPDDLRAALENVVFDVVDFPDPAVDRSSGEPPSMLGLYTGDPISEQHSSVSAMPPVIRIFKRNIEHYSMGDPDEARRQIEITILHEIGHHLGWDEDDLDERGLA